MSFQELTIIRKNNGASPDRGSLDRKYYCQGKADAMEELSRDPSVYCSSTRDKDCYNMGYSYGERYND